MWLYWNTKGELLVTLVMHCTVDSLSILFHVSHCAEVAVKLLSLSVTVDRLVFIPFYVGTEVIKVCLLLVSEFKAPSRKSSQDYYNSGSSSLPCMTKVTNNFPFMFQHLNNFWPLTEFGRPYCSSPFCTPETPSLCQHTTKVQQVADWVCFQYTWEGTCSL